MKRWIVKAGATSSDQLILEEGPIPEPGPGEVRVRVHAISLNRRDEILLTGAFQVASSDFIPTSDGAGVIDGLGSGVDKLALGDKVVGNYFPSWIDGPPASGQGWGLGSPGQDGMLTEYAVLKAERLTKIPGSLAFEEAACLPCAALTAWTALHGDRPYRRPVLPGAKVLVTGTGAVSLFAILFAKALHAEVVATTSDDSKIERVKALGAAAVVNYKSVPNWGETAASEFGAFDLIVNSAGSASLDQTMAAAAPGGEIALMGLYEFANKSPDFIPLMSKGLSIRGTAVGSSMAFLDMLTFIDAHSIKPPISQRFLFAEAKAAYRAASSGQAFGKVVITTEAAQ